MFFENFKYTGLWSLAHDTRMEESMTISCSDEEMKKKSSLRCILEFVLVD